MNTATQLIYVPNSIQSNIHSSPYDISYGDDLNPPTRKKSLPRRAWHILRSLLPWLAYVVLLAVLPLAIEKSFGSQGLLYYILCLFVLGFAALGLAVRRRR
jgi:hypothetical protein